MHKEKNQPRLQDEPEDMRITWGLIRDLKCILRFLVDSNGTTIVSYRGRTIRIS